MHHFTCWTLFISNVNKYYLSVHNDSSPTGVELHNGRNILNLRFHAVYWIRSHEFRHIVHDGRLLIPTKANALEIYCCDSCHKEVISSVRNLLEFESISLSTNNKYTEMDNQTDNRLNNLTAHLIYQ